jgi:hypothetical protein
MFHYVVENKIGKITVLGLSKISLKIKRLEGAVQDILDN